MTDREIVTMARWIAKQKVIEAIRERGSKVSHYSFKELIELADAWIVENRAEVMREVFMRKWIARFICSKNDRSSNSSGRGRTDFHG